jgi:hypothetical protein
MDDPAGVLIDKFDRVTQGWLERDGRIECKDTCKGRLCMRKEITDPAVVKKPDPALDLENLLTPDALLEKPDPAKGLDALVPDALREKKGLAKPSLEDDLTPDALRDEK